MNSQALVSSTVYKPEYCEYEYCGTYYCVRYTGPERRETEHSHNWLDEGWHCADYDFDTNEYILRPNDAIQTLTIQQARLLSYNSIDDLSDREYATLFGVPRQPL